MNIITNNNNQITKTPVYGVILDCSQIQDSEYIDENLHDMFLKEKGCLPVKHFMSYQKNIVEEQRRILVDWLMDTADIFRQHGFTYLVAVQFLDRYLSLVNDVLLSDFQSLGVVCLFLASKSQEERHIASDDLIYVCDDLLDKERLFEMERKVIGTLKYTLNPVTPFHFWAYWKDTAIEVLRVNEMIKEFKFTVKYLLKVSICYDSETLTSFHASILTASSIYLAHYILFLHSDWNTKMIKLTTYELKDMITCIGHLWTNYVQYNNDFRKNSNKNTMMEYNLGRQYLAAIKNSKANKRMPKCLPKALILAEFIQSRVN